MSTNIHILAEGYAKMVDSKPTSKHKEKFMLASCSSCLVQSEGLSILFDTMGPWEQNILLQKMAELKVHQDDINYLVCSHSHPDHIGNINLFTKAIKHFIGTSVYTKDVYDLNCFEPIGNYTYKTSRDINVDVVKYQEFTIGKNLRIEPTPGHTMECISLIIDNCDKLGKVGLVGDLFEREEDLNDESVWLSAGSQNPDLQRAQRARLFSSVDYILPGHGPLFRVNSKEIKF